MAAARVYSLEELISQVGHWRNEGLKIGFTCGSFDLLHAGHAHYLQQARALCDRLIVAVNTDASVRSYKGPFRPIIPEHSRAQLVAALKAVSAVVLMDDTRPLRLLELLQPELYIKGGDYTVGDLKSAPVVEAYGGRAVVIPMQHAVSTSAILERIQHLSIYAAPDPPLFPLHPPLVLLDRDGTLIENVHFLKDPARVRLCPGVGEGLKLLQDAGFSLAVLTNQQGLGLGYFDYDSFVEVNSQMLRLLSPFGIRIARFYFCPHSFAEQCSCRKPGTRLIERALADFHCPPSECFLIGDSPADLSAAQAAGCHGILLAPDPSENTPPPFLAATHSVVAAAHAPTTHN